MDLGSEHAFWRERWQLGHTGWDQGGAHPALLDLLKVAQRFGFSPQNARVLEPACGRAHNGATLANLGSHVVSFDVVPEAIGAAQEMYGSHPRLRCVDHDACVLRPAWCGQFTAIFDRAALCALKPDMRPRYLETAWQYLVPGGLFLTIPFTRVHGDPHQGPPFSIPLREMIPLMEPRFELLYAETLPELSPEQGRVACEMLMVWRRA